MTLATANRPRSGLRLAAGWLAVGCLIITAGCGYAGGRRAVSGTVTYQGQPLKEGHITFLTTTEPLGPMSGGLLTDGRFDIPAEQGLEPGTYRVAISWAVPGGTRTPEQVAAGASAPAKEMIPAKYNSETTLTAEVKASGANEFTFTLE